MLQDLRICLLGDVHILWLLSASRRQRDGAASDGASAGMAGVPSSADGVSEVPPSSPYQRNLTGSLCVFYRGGLSQKIKHSAGSPIS